MKKKIQEIAQYLSDNGFTPEAEIRGYYWDVDNQHFNIDISVKAKENDPNEFVVEFTFFEASLNQSANMVQMAAYIETEITNEMN